MTKLLPWYIETSWLAACIKVLAISFFRSFFLSTLIVEFFQADFSSYNFLQRRYCLTEMIDSFPHAFIVSVNLLSLLNLRSILRIYFLFFIQPLDKKLLVFHISYIKYDKL